MVYTLCGPKRPSLKCSKSWLVPRISTVDWLSERPQQRSPTVLTNSSQQGYRLLKTAWAQIKDQVNQTGIDRKELLSWLIHGLISQNIDMAFILLSFN